MIPFVPGSLLDKTSLTDQQNGMHIRHLLRQAEPPNQLNVEQTPPFTGQI